MFFFALPLQADDVINVCTEYYEKYRVARSTGFLGVSSTSTQDMEYILYVLVPAAIVRAMQIHHNMGSNEAQKYFDECATVSEEEIKLTGLQWSQETLSKTQRRAVNRRTAIHAAKAGLPLQFAQDELCSTSEEEL